MNCSEVLSHFFELNRDKELPPEIVTHIEGCESCRRVMLRMNRAMELIAESSRDQWLLSHDEQSRLTDAIMAKIQTEVVQDGAEDVPSMALGRWILAGVIIVAAMPLASFSNSVQWLRSILGSRLDFPMNLVLGLVVAIYSLLFIGTHLNELARWLHLRTRVMPRK